MALTREDLLDLNASDDEIKNYLNPEPDFTPQAESTVGTAAQGMFGTNFGLDALTGLGGTKPDDPDYVSPADLARLGFYDEGNSFGKQVEQSLLDTQINSLRFEYQNIDSQVQKIEEQLKLATEQNNQEEIDRLNLILNGTQVDKQRDELPDYTIPTSFGAPSFGFMAQQQLEKKDRATEVGLLAYKDELNKQTSKEQAKANSIKQSDALKITSQYPNAENVLYNLTQGTTLSQKIDIVGDIVGLSSVPMVQSLAAGAIATVVGGPFAGAAAAGTTSGVIDYNRSFFEYLEKKGVDITDPESLDIAYRNKELIEAAELYSTKRGVAIGALDALSFGIGTKVLAPAKVQNMMARAVINSAYQSPIQATLGGTGEALAQYFNLEEGENLNYADIAFEALGEFAFAPVEVTFAQLSAGRNEWVRAKNVSKENHLRKQIQFENTLNRAKEIDGQKSQTIKQQVDQRASDLQKVGQTEEESRSQAIDEFIDTSPEFKAAFEIYEDFTDSSRSPENFPTVVSNETGQYPNAFTVKTNEDGTFTIYDALGNPLVNPKTNETYTYQSQQQALKIQKELSSISQIQYAIDTTQDVLLMQNADKDNPTIKGLGRILNNPYYDGISIQELEELNVSEQTLQLVKDATGSKNSISISELKNILSKSQFDKIINQRAEDFKADPTYEELITISKLDNISAPKLKKLFKQKNIDVDFNSNAFKKLALQLTGETNIDSMSAAQRRILYAAINELPQSSQTIPLPDFSTRTYNLNDYSKALEAIIKLNDPSLKTIQDNTSLNAEEAKRLREDLVTSGYVKETNGRYKFVGTGNQKYNFDGSLKLEGEVNDNERLEKIKSSLLKQFKSIGLESTGIKFVDYVTNAQGQIINDAQGSYDPVFDQIIIPIDRAGQDYKNNPEKYLSELAVNLTHENWHSLRQADVLNESEYTTLRNYVLNTKPKGSKNTYYEQAIEEYTTEQALELGAVQSEADVIEEAIARAFEDFAKNKKSITGKPQQIFNKVSNFFERTSNAFQDNGFQNATDIFNKVQKGNISNRETGIVRTTLELDRVNSGFENIIQTAKAAGIDTEEVEDSFYSRMSDAPQLKYSLAKSGVNPLTREFLFGLKHNQFTDQIDVFTNVSENKDEILSNFLTKRRKQDLNNTKELRSLISVTGALSQIALETDIKKGLIEVNPDNTTPMYLVGDISRSKFTTMHRSKADAIRTAQLQGHLYYTPIGNNTKVTTVNVPLRAVGFHPRIYNVGNEGAMSNPYNKQGEQLFGIESSSIPLNKVSEENIEPLIGQAPRTKFSLKRTAGRLDNATVQELMEEANYNNLAQVAFRNMNDPSKSTNPYILNLMELTDPRSSGVDLFGGSEFIAATLELDKKFIDRMMMSYILGQNAKKDNLSVVEEMPTKEQIIEAQGVIKEITDASLENFPEYIVVYRGGNIKDNYDVIPVTTSKEAANIFAASDSTKYEYDQDSVIKEFLVPKSKVLANMNALMMQKTQINFSPIQSQTSKQVYSYADEMELLVNREDLEISGIDRVPEIEVKKIHERIQKEKSQGKENYEDFEFQQLGIGFLGLTDGFNSPILKGMDDREFVNEQNKLKQLINNIDLASINQEQLLELLNHPALVEAELRMFSIPILEEEVQTQTVLDLIEKANSYAGNTVEQGKKATILIGLPASGKSFYAEQLATEQQAAIVDSDDAKRILPGYGSGLGANSVAPLSSQYSNLVLKTLSDNGSNIIIPTVGGSKKYQSIQKKIKMLQDKGYEVSVGLIDTDFNHALIRMLNRFTDSGRLIATDYFVDVDNTPRDTYNELKRTGLVTNFAFLNNNFAQGQQTVEEDNTQLFRQFGSPRQIGIGDVRQSYAERTRLSEAIEQAVEEANQEKQKSLDAGATPVINTAVNPESIYSAVEARKLIRNTPAENSADIDSIINDLDTNLQLKYSVKNTRKKLIPEAERLMDRMTNRQSRPDDNLTIGQKLLSVFKGFPSAQQFREGIIDQYSRAAETDYIAGKESDIGNKMLSASVSAAAALYHSDRSGDIFQQAWLRGVPVYDKEKGYTTVKSEIDGQTIVAPQEIFKEAYKNSSLLDAFQAVLRVKRETRFNKEGRKTKITSQDKKDAAILLKQYPEVGTMVEQYQAWNSYLVQFLVDTGVLNEKTAEIWLANSDYIPFYRDMEGQEGFKGPKIFQGLQITPFKEAKGSETLDIVDPITGITNNLRAAINAGMKNVASNRVMRNLIIMGVAKQVKGTPGFTPPIGHVRIKVNGETKTFKVDDPDYFNAFTIQTGNMGPEGFLAKSLGSILRPTKQAISELITRMPDFWFRQVLRDSISAWGLSGANYAPVLASIKESVSIAVGMARGKLPPEYEALRNAGVIAGYDKNVRDIDSTESLIKNLYKDEMKSRRSTIKKVYMAPFDALVKMWDILGQGTAITDAATRVAVYKDTLKRTDDEAEAISQAMEVLNFTRRGNDPMFQFASQTIMFLNPRLQGLDVFYRGLTGKYGIGRGLSKSQRATSVAIRMIGMMSLMPWYYLAVRDTDEYKEAPEEIKDNYIIFPILSRLVGSTIAMPKPFEVGLLTMTIPERLMAYMLDDDAAGDFGDSLSRNISHTFAVSPPTAIAPLVENFFNYDLYTGRPIVPPYMQDKGDLSFRPSTSSLARKLGDETNTSPLYWDNIIRDYTGSMGTYAMLAVDSVLRDSSRGDRPSLRVDQLPVVGTFLLNPEGSGLENEFFELKKMTDDLVSSFRVLDDHITKSGDMSVLEMTDEYQLQYKDVFKNLQGELQLTSDFLKEAREEIAIIQNSRTMNGAEKTKEIQEIKRLVNLKLKLQDVSGTRKFVIDELVPKAVTR